MTKNLVAGDVENWPIDKIKPYEKNAKLHDSKDIAFLAENIRRDGFRGYVRVDKHGVLIGGHKRRLAAIAAGLTFLPVIVDSHLNEDAVKAARLSENKLNGNSYDELIVHDQLIELKESDFDMSAMGFDERELDFFTDDLANIDLDSIITDLDVEVEEQAERIKAKVEQIDEATVPISEAFGFKTFTLDQARVIVKFMSTLEDETKTTGAECFTIFAKSLIPKVSHE